MNLNEGTADLHIHTTASDGTSTVEERVEQANDKGLEAIAITDHDCIPESLKKPRRNERGVNIITGVEIKADVFGTKTEILGYYVDPDDKNLSELLEKVRRYRKERNRELVEDFIEVTRIETSHQEMNERAEGQLRHKSVEATMKYDQVPVEERRDALDRMG